MEEFEITVDLGGTIQTMERVEDSAKDTGPLMDVIADVLLEGVADNYANEEGPEGPWPELAESTQEDRRKSGYDPRHPMLIRSRQLESSIQPHATASEASVFTNKIYAPIQFLGGKPDMPPGPAAIPARNPMWINDEMEDEIDHEVDEHFDTE